MIHQGVALQICDRHLPAAPPFVLESDRELILGFNSRRGDHSKHWIHTGRTPEPRLGPIDAPIVILQLNASYDQSLKHIALTSSEIAKARHHLEDETSPHSCLIESNPWWDRAFKQPIAQFGRERVASRVCSVEYFAYPSARFAHRHLAPPSQSYQFELVRRALLRKAIIIVTRGWDLWTEVAPELIDQECKTVFRGKNRQRVYISEGNLPAGAYSHICKALE